jgi:hypothetical protein
MAREDRIPAEAVRGLKQYRYYESRKFAKWRKFERARRGPTGRVLRRKAKARAKALPVHLKGDRREEPLPPGYFLSFANQFHEWNYRAKVGLEEMPDIQLLRHDLEPVAEAIRELCAFTDDEWASIRPSKMFQERLAPDEYQKQTPLPAKDSGWRPSGCDKGAYEVALNDLNLRRKRNNLL